MPYRERGGQWFEKPGRVNKLSRDKEIELERAYRSGNADQYGQSRQERALEDDLFADAMSLELPELREPYRDARGVLWEDEGRTRGYSKPAGVSQDLLEYYLRKRGM